MKMILLLLSFLLTLTIGTILGPAQPCYGQPNGDLSGPTKSIIIKGSKPTDFSHSIHADARIFCSQCHHDATGQPLDADTIAARTDSGALQCTGCHNNDFANIDLREKKTIFHTLCRGCHQSILDANRGPTRCGECHAIADGESMEGMTVEKIQETTDSNTCLGCHNHMSWYKDFIKKKSVHKPFLEMKCKRCHDVVRATEAEEQVKEQISSQPTKAGAEAMRIKWIGKDYTPEYIHWFTVPPAKVGKEIFIFGGMTEQDAFRAKINVPAISTLKEIKDDKTPPKISDVKVVEVKHGVFIGATIEWTTDESSDSLVTFGTENLDGKTQLDAQLLKKHRLNLSNLLPNTVYHFAVVSQDLFGNKAANPPLTFSTAKAFTTKNPETVQPAGKTPSTPSAKQGDADDTLKLKKEFFKINDNYAIKLTIGQPITVFLATYMPPATKSKKKASTWTMKDRINANNEIPEMHWVLADKAFTAVDLCLTCHVDMERKNLHPLKVPFPRHYGRPDDFMTYPDGRMACISCHDPHAADGRHLTRRDEKGLLCIACHIDKNDTLPEDFMVH